MGKEGSYLHSIHLRYGEYIALFAEIIGYVLRRCDELDWGRFAVFC